MSDDHRSGAVEIIDDGPKWRAIAVMAAAVMALVGVIGSCAATVYHPSVSAWLSVKAAEEARLSIQLAGAKAAFWLVIYASLAMIALAAVTLVWAWVFVKIKAWRNDEPYTVYPGIDKTAALAEPAGNAIQPVAATVQLDHRDAQRRETVFHGSRRPVGIFGAFHRLWRRAAGAQHGAERQRR